MIDLPPVPENPAEHSPKRKRRGGKRPLAHLERTSLRENGWNFHVRMSPEDGTRLQELAAYMGFGTNKTACFRKLLHDKCREVGIMSWPGRKKAFDLNHHEQEERTTL